MKIFHEKFEEINLTPEKEDKRRKILRDKVIQLDLDKVITIKDLVEAWKNCSIQSRSLAECAIVYENMLLDEDNPIIFIGLSGALIAGGLRKVISDMISKGIVDVVVSTGAILYQDYYLAQGYNHYKGYFDISDEELHSLYINRIYDTYVDEIGFVECDEKIAEFCKSLEPRGYSTREFLYILGSTIRDENSILFNAYRYNIPIFCPAIADSSIGIALAGYFRWAKENNVKTFYIDIMKDNYEIAQIVLKSKKTGAIYIGGGVPKNYINDASVMLKYTKGHYYAIQITTEPPHWGGLSGSTLDEAKSWGKISEKARRAIVYSEATIALPLIVGYIFQKGLYKNRKRPKFIWLDNGDLDIQY